MPLTHIHLKEILQNYMQKSTFFNSTHVTENAIHYLLSATYIEYMTLQYKESSEKIVIARNGVQHLWNDSIRTMKRIFNKYSNNDSISPSMNRISVLDYIEDNDILLLKSCTFRDGVVVWNDCLQLWSDKNA